MQTYKIVFTVYTSMEDSELFDYILTRNAMLEVHNEKTGGWAKPDHWDLTGGRINRE